MKILWANCTFLHPTTKGGQIRTLEMLRLLHLRHEIHYVSLLDPGFPEAVALSAEYSTQAYPIRHSVPRRGTAAFAVEAAINLFSSLPLSVARYRSKEMRQTIEMLHTRHRFDAVVCDFLFPSLNFPELANTVLFEHNVETAIWERHAAMASNSAAKLYLRQQARRMLRYEREVCRAVRRVVAVSDVDAARFREMFSATDAISVPTGVNLEYFAPPSPAPPRMADLVFVGSMDWMPNIDAIAWFCNEILPRIRVRRPDCSVAIVGRTPPPRITALAGSDPKIQVTGTVPDIRPFLWGSAVSIVPMRIGSGTRLKIYESMAARVPVVSTTVGAEGLQINPPDDIRIGDTPEAFADACLQLLDNTAVREQTANAAWNLVNARFSWEQVAREFEEILAATVVRS